MNLLKVVREVRLHLEENGRLSLSMIRRQFELDEGTLEDIIEELVDVQGVARREEKVLVWNTAATLSEPAPTITTTRNAIDYTPKHLADKILQSKSALEGERKQVTVMFADVKGSMDLAGQLDPEDWHKVLDRFFEILGEGVHRFEGTINQYTGDGIMALFGAPIAHEDHAQRACHAALLLRDLLADFSDEIRRGHGVDFSTRIGLNSGEVVVGKIGDDLRMDYTAQGLAVGLAQRMESLAETGKPYLTQYTANLAQGFFELENLGEFNVKGVDHPMPVFALVGQGSAHNRVERLDGVGLTTFIGRDLEMETLKAAYAESLEGRGQVIGIVGGPGVGKSRLLREFANYIKEQNGYAITTHNPSHSKNVPLSSFLAAMRDEFRIDIRDEPAVSRQKVVDRFTESFPASMEFCPLICDFLGVPDPDHPLSPMSPDQRKQKLQEFQERNLKPRTEKECTVMLFEDLHWIDSVSESLFEYQLNVTPSARQMCVCSYRPEYTPPSISKSFFRQMPLQPLNDAANKSLTANLLGPELSESELARRIQQRCAGNPFFTEETIQSMAESGVLEGERGAYTTTHAADDIPFPATVQAVLDARIDRLDETEKHILQTASVIGRNFLRTILESIVEIDEARLNSAVDTLKDAEFIFEESQYPEIEYSFKHAITRDSAYASQLNDRRESVHAAVAGALELHYTHQVEEKSALIAQNWEQAGQTLEAIRWHGRAAQWVGKLDLAAATRHWRSVRKLRKKLPDQSIEAKLGYNACRQLLQNMCFRVAVDMEEADALLDEGKSLARILDDKRESLYMSMIYSRVLCSDGDVPTGLEMAFENRRASMKFDEMTQFNAAHFLIDSLWVAGRFEETIKYSEEEMNRVPRHVPREEWLWGFEHSSLLYIWNSSTRMWIGQINEAIEGLAEGIKRSISDQTPELAGYAHHYAAEACLYAGDPENAFMNARATEKISQQRPDDEGLSATNELGLGYAHLAAKQYEEAIQHLDVFIFAKTDKAYAGKSGAYKSLALLESGKLNEAITEAEEAITLCRRSLRIVYEGLALGVIARALIQRDGSKSINEANALLEEASSLFEKAKATTFFPHLLEWRAEVAAASSDHQERERFLRKAIKLHNEAGAPRQAERVEQELNS